jgi:DNA mismatch repair protein MutL
MLQLSAMEPRVTQLPEELINRIAAGEVVARPASVVKELLDNSIDAGAATLRVEIEGGGVTRIRVIDDGAGIHPGDVMLALERHATSKIARAEDLDAITTLGFRGEALASIAAVSQLTLRSRRRSDDAGSEVIVHGGSLVSRGPCGMAPGSVLEVADLFFNVPARRKFLRAVATESAHVSHVVLCAALARPSLSFELWRDGRLGQRWLAAQSREDRARDVLGDVPLVAIGGERGPIALEAFVSLPERARTGAGGLYLFVNDRPVADRALARAVASAYGDALEGGRYPLGAVFLHLPLELVDVNVHPQKSEVRFAQARAVTDALFALVRDGLRRVPGAALKTGASKLGPPREAEPTERWHFADSGALASAAAPSSLPSTLSNAAARPGTLDVVRESDERLAPRAEVVGVVRARYLVCSDAFGIFIVDRRRVHELWLAGRARRELESGALGSQRLLFPVVREIDEATSQQLEARAPELERLGLDLRPRGAGIAVLHGVPRTFARAAPEVLLSEALAAVTAAGRRSWDDGATSRLLDAMAIRAAVASLDNASLDSAGLEDAAQDAAHLAELDLAGDLEEARLMRVTFAELARLAGE